MSKEHKVERKDKVYWWCSVLAAICYLACVVPMMPWRFAKVDTNMGNRFVMDRQYRLFGTTDQFGKGIGWLTLKTKFKRKHDEFGRPSPITALVGTASAMLGVGGAATGCATWQVCKDHVTARYYGYNSVAIGGIASAVLIMIAMFCTIGSIVLMGFEGDSKKKKKKKDDEDCCTPRGRTMTCCCFAWVFALSGVNCFVFLLDGTLKTFKDTAYYPYAMSYPGAFVGWAGCFFQFICVFIAMWRAEMFGKKAEPEKEDMYGGGYGPPGGYPPPGAYGPGYGK